MASIAVSPLRDDLSFGARIAGVSHETLKDDAIRARIVATFEDRGVILFEDVEPSSRLHVALSQLFGALKEIPAAIVARTELDTPPTVIDIRHNPADPATAST